MRGPLPGVRLNDQQAAALYWSRRRRWLLPRPDPVDIAAFGSAVDIRVPEERAHFNGTEVPYSSVTQTPGLTQIPLAWWPEGALVALAPATYVAATYAARADTISTAGRMSVTIDPATFGITGGYGVLAALHDAAGGAMLGIATDGARLFPLNWWPLGALVAIAPLVDSIPLDVSLAKSPTTVTLSWTADSATLTDGADTVAAPRVEIADPRALVFGSDPAGNNPVTGISRVVLYEGAE